MLYLANVGDLPTADKKRSKNIISRVKVRKVCLPAQKSGNKIMVHGIPGGDELLFPDKVLGGEPAHFSLRAKLVTLVPS